MGFMQKKVKSHYEVLGVAPDATADELKKAYRKLALVLHPDKRGADVTEEEANDRFQRVVQAYKILGDNATRKEYDDVSAAELFAADAAAPEGGVHNRDTWNDVIARLQKQAKKSKKEKERLIKERDAAAAPNAAEVGENLPFPAAPRIMGCLPQEVVLEVFGCAGINRLVEVQYRPRVSAVGAAFAKPGDWKQAFKFTMREAEISRLTVVKKLEPLTAYTFRARAGVQTEDLGDEWKGEAGKLVPEIFGPWSDESVLAKTTELTDKEALRRLKMEKRSEAKEKAVAAKVAKRAKKEERAAKKKERKKGKSSKKGKKERREVKKISRKDSREKLRKKRKREAYESSSDSDSSSSSSCSNSSLS